ncbi:hypothetical protein J8I87_41690 [Paraburkholderia sp. LEh10]|uniref:hypothetical protein n=1 Tax=Paraburkholderia sp. LEh10 TaxID=2821353 RepID=UPI001AE6589C|nr:hypothetical protein [Paraburkholderia sp. LEh10]MBP0596015.1 hypothetical protein [Paraburkholderia sp. LEh10]
MVKELKAAGVDVLDREFVSDKTIDFRGILTAIKSKDAQAIFYGVRRCRSDRRLRKSSEVRFCCAFCALCIRCHLGAYERDEAR